MIFENSVIFENFAFFENLAIFENLAFFEKLAFFENLGKSCAGKILGVFLLGKILYREDFVPGRFWVFFYLGRFCAGRFCVVRFCAGRFWVWGDFVSGRLWAVILFC